MQNKYLIAASRSIINTFFLGAVAAASIFMAYTLKATGERMFGTLTEDIHNIRNHEVTDNSRKAA